jgi:hypothetical protein
VKKVTAAHSDNVVSSSRVSLFYFISGNILLLVYFYGNRWVVSFNYCTLFFKPSKQIIVVIFFGFLVVSMETRWKVTRLFTIEPEDDSVKVTFPCA